MPDIETTIVQTCLRGLSELLLEAASLAKAAAGCAEDGNRNGAIGIALEVEPLLAEAGTLLNAASLIHRKHRP